MKQNVELASYEANIGLYYNARKNGDTINVHFKLEEYVYNFYIIGDGKYASFMMSSSNPIAFNCERMNKSVFEEFNAKKEAINKFKEEKKKAQAGATKH